MTMPVVQKRSSDGEHREATKINCGVLITGQEMPTADIALFSRVIFLESQKSEKIKGGNRQVSKSS